MQELKNPATELDGDRQELDAQWSNFVIILLIALISIINWLVQKSKERREARKLEKRADSTGESAKVEQAEPPATEAEIAMRRLREALGLPEEAAPPALPKRVEQPPPERPIAAPASPACEKAGRLARSGCAPQRRASCI